MFRSIMELLKAKEIRGDCDKAWRRGAMRSSVFYFALVVFLAPFLAAPFALAAQTEPEAPKTDAKGDELIGHRLQLRGMQDTLEESQEQRRKIESEVDSIRSDRAKLTTALLDLTRSIGVAESKISEAEARLDTLTGSEEAIKRSLASRRGVIAEVLAALQRMGRKPPPALLVAPEDMLVAIRTSMLLGAVLPEMRAETEALAGDLSDLLQLRRAIAGERDTLAEDAAQLRLDRQRLAALVDARQAALSAAEQALGAERDRAADLAKRAANLKDLIAKMESEVAAAARGAEAARKADEARKTALEAIPPEARRKTAALSPFKDPARLAPASAFAETKGLLPLPVAGALQRSFGASDGFGGVEKGMLIATRTKAIVASPCDGWVSFAGRFRTYGQLLIINAGQGYYIIVAGMDRIDVNVGQFILAGEPVAVMGDGSAKTAAAIAIEAEQPILYVEFRKDGAAIDPGPWWAKPEMQKVRG
jgi:septal ring factor EnvC (AmiA/AmiB activator)